MFTVAAASAPFGRDLDQNYGVIAGMLGDARRVGADLLVLPEAALGGYLSSLGSAGETLLPVQSQPPALSLDGPEIARVIRMAGPTVVCLGLCERAGDRRYNTAVALDGSGILGIHRKVHQPLGEGLSYAAGDSFRAFETPFGRLGMLICYDKAFPEAARSLALDGASVIACLSAWPASRSARAADLAGDRWTHRFNLFDQARALENQVLWASANQCGRFGSLRFVGHAKVVGPGGDVLASTGLGPGLAVARVDLDGMLRTARQAMCHLQDRRPDTYVSAAPEVVDA